MKDLADLGLEFRLWVTAAKTQRTFVVSDFLKLLTRYSQGMSPEFTEKATVETIKDRIISNPELPRKSILEMAMVRATI